MPTNNQGSDLRNLYAPQANAVGTRPVGLADVIQTGVIKSNLAKSVASGAAGATTSQARQQMDAETANLKAQQAAELKGLEDEYAPKPLNLSETYDYAPEYIGEDVGTYEDPNSGVGQGNAPTGPTGPSMADLGISMGDVAGVVGKGLASTALSISSANPLGVALAMANMAIGLHGLTSAPMAAYDMAEAAPSYTAQAEAEGDLSAIGLTAESLAGTPGSQTTSEVSFAEGQDAAANAGFDSSSSFAAGQDAAANAGFGEGGFGDSGGFAAGQDAAASAGFGDSDGDAGGGGGGGK